MDTKENGLIGGNVGEKTKKMKHLRLASKIFSGSFLVAGTAIGAGMLALPLATANAGFLPALAIYAVCWLFSMATGFLMLEITLKMKEHANLVTMSSHFLGKVGSGLAWILYIFLFYCLTIAYVAGGSSMVGSMWFGGNFPLLSTILFVGVFGGAVFFGTKIVDRMNVFLMVALISSYFGFVTFGTSHVNLTFLKKVDFPAVVLALPVIFTSFSYQGILPTLTDYLKRDRKAIRYSIVFGTTIPFMAYIVWDFLIKGIVPLESLLVAKDSGFTAVEPLKNYLNSPFVLTLGQSFAFFALATSFLGVTLGLLDFLADGLKVSKKGWGRFWLCVLIYLPTAIVARTYPGIFFMALEYAGGIGCVLLLGLFPILMVWVKRYVKKEGRSHPELFGGQWLLILLIIFILFEIGVTLS
jgi:tyrosine-specific transport protein